MKIPLEVFSPILVEITQGMNAREVSEKAGLHRDAVAHYRNGVTKGRKFIKFDAADRLLCSLNQNLRWYRPPLSEFYWTINLEPKALSKPKYVSHTLRTCEICGRKYHRRYYMAYNLCSDTCIKKMFAKMKNHSSPKCKNGHTRTWRNTRWTKPQAHQPWKIIATCMECKENARRRTGAA